MLDRRKRRCRDSAAGLVVLGFRNIVVGSREKLNRLEYWMGDG